MSLPKVTYKDRHNCRHGKHAIDFKSSGGSSTVNLTEDFTVRIYFISNRVIWIDER